MAKRKQKQEPVTPAKKAKTEPSPSPMKKLLIPVDVAFRESTTARVFVDSDGLIYDAALNQTNVSGNNNKFYFLQLLTNEDSEFWTQTRWGRVGEAGQSKAIGPKDFDGALYDFEKKFSDKTGLTWATRGDPPKFKKYTYLEKSYEDSDSEKEDTPVTKEEIPAKECNLPKPTQQLLELIFNKDHFTSMLEDIGYDSDKLPLGKLSKSTMKKGFDYLKELSELLQDATLALTKHQMTYDKAIEDFTNKYYTVIPHVFRRGTVPPLIDNDDLLRREVGMLDDLTDMSVAEKIMKTKANTNLMEKRFEQLNLTELTPLESSSQEFQHLSDYLVKSSSAGHGLQYELLDVFRLERMGEFDRFDKSYSSVKKKNRLLLWHGSRSTNFGGILSQGLRIAPPEAPVSGYAFGKGIYMADISSKSAAYCYSMLSSGIGLLLLCEAELCSPMFEISTGAWNAQELAQAKKCVSTKGVGRLTPLKWKDAGCVHEKLKGVMMPEGVPGVNVDADERGYLLYNEYIAYDVAQVRLRYLLKVKMS